MLIMNNDPGPTGILTQPALNSPAEYLDGTTS